MKQPKRIKRARVGALFHCMKCERGEISKIGRKEGHYIVICICGEIHWMTESGRYGSIKRKETA